MLTLHTECYIFLLGGGRLVEVGVYLRLAVKVTFTLSGVFSFPYVISLIRITGQAQPIIYISMESLWNYINDGAKFV